MSEPKLISPLLDGLLMGDPINEHHGICCCPALKEDTQEKYIVKIISVPASAAQMDALLLTGAYPDKAAVLAYYKDVADEIIGEIEILKRLSEQEGYIPYDGWQAEPMEDGNGYDIYVLRPYNRTLELHFKRHAFTHLDALNLGLDLCAAMSVSRRSGYLYVGLKPGNIFVTEQGQYKVGGLGFIKLDSLKYMSLPEKSRSIYTPAEISDAYAALNTTIDVYAIGLILYQAYNNGELPFNENVVPGHKLPPPLYADYEMSEIILKACHPDPAARWQEPVEMGQAIVEYMQRNGALDTPIVPVPTPEEDEADDQPNEQTEESSTDTAENEPAEADAPGDAEGEDTQAAYEEDALGNLTFLTDVTMEDLELTGEETDYEELSGEVTEILSQADELSTLAVPEPVNVPDYIELPELPAEPEPEEAEDEEAAGSVDEDTEGNAEEASEEEDSQDSEDIDEEFFEELPKKRHWVRNSVILLVIAALLAAGYYLYNRFYVIHIDSILLNGAENSLTVQIKTEADEALLKVICVDSYGNQIPASVVDGKAEFKDLLPSTAYNIKIIADGQRKVKGVGNLNYSTPIQTNIVRFDAITGAADGSVILTFTVDGPDSTQWAIHYTAKDESERSVDATAHSATVSDLTVGKEYKFRLVPKDDLYYTGQTELTYTAQKVVKAENVQIVSCMNNELVVKWSAPSDAAVAAWQVSCTGGTYNQTLTVSETTATFQNLDHTSNFVVEVKAENMSEGVRQDIAANTATVSDLKADNSDHSALKFTWNTSLPVPADGWKLHYTVVGIEKNASIACNKNEAVITSVIPNATYRVWLTDAKDAPLLSATMEAKTGNAPDYSQKVGSAELKRADLKFRMCRSNALLEWDGEDLADLELASTFSAGASASFLIEITKEDIVLTDDSVEILYVIRDAESAPVFQSTASNTLAKMWSDDYCRLQLPPLPTTAGSYTIDVYFNGCLAASQQFKIS